VAIVDGREGPPGGGVWGGVGTRTEDAVASLCKDPDTEAENIFVAEGSSKLFHNVVPHTACAGDE
jgi:hypothetical protein